MERAMCHPPNDENDTTITSDIPQDEQPIDDDQEDWEGWERDAQIGHS